MFTEVARLVPPEEKAWYRDAAAPPFPSSRPRSTTRGGVARSSFFRVRAKTVQTNVKILAREIPYETSLENLAAAREAAQEDQLRVSAMEQDTRNHAAGNFWWGSRDEAFQSRGIPSLDSKPIGFPSGIIR